jgi:hypothetical protein
MGNKQSAEQKQQTITEGLNQVIQTTIQTCSADVETNQKITVSDCAPGQECSIEDAHQDMTVMLNMTCIQERKGDIGFKDEIKNNIDSFVTQKSDALDLGEQTAKVTQMIKNKYTNIIDDIIRNDCDFDYDFDQEISITAEDNEDEDKIDEGKVSTSGKKTIKKVRQKSIKDITNTCNQDSDLVTRIATDIDNILYADTEQKQSGTGVWMTILAIVVFFIILMFMFYSFKKKPATAATAGRGGPVRGGGGGGSGLGTTSFVAAGGGGGAFF